MKKIVTIFFILKSFIFASQGKIIREAINRNQEINREERRRKKKKVLRSSKEKEVLMRNILKI